jgi:hypothetical protein
MFISYKFINCLGEKDDKHICEFGLTDSEFGTALGTVAINKFDLEIGIAVIQEYSKRNLNVAANLMRAFIWYNKQYPWWSIQQLIDYNKNHYPLFQQYEKDLQKYLVLL